MNEFIGVFEVKPETKYHYQKEILEINKAESEKNKEVWFQNYGVNSALLKKHKKADILFNDKKWAQQECLLVGAGPSLDLDIENIKKYRKNVNIICVDSALNPLIQSGIKPNFVFTKNCGEDITDLFTGFPTNDLKIIANLFQPPELFKKCKSDFYLYVPFDEDIFLNNFAQLNQQIPKLLNKTSTLVMAFILARAMNFKTIYLLGADFCFQDHDKIYCDNCLYKKNQYPESDLCNLENIFLDKVPTYKNLFISSEDFFRIIVSESLDTLYNCSQNSILYNLNWVPFDEVMKRKERKAVNFFETASVQHTSGDAQIDRINDLTLNYFKALMSKSMFNNLKRFEKEETIDELFKTKGQYGDKYALICGAGPSLNDNLDLVKEFREYFTIFGVDSSLLPLYKKGIEADYILSIDPCNTSKFFEGYKSDRTSVIASIHTHYEGIKSWQNKILFYFPIPIRKFDYWLLSLIEGYSTIPFLTPFNNCGSTSFLFAHQLGFKEIALMGLDFSYTANRWYTQGAVTEEIFGLEKIDSESKIEANFQKMKLEKVYNCVGEIVYTDATFKLYASTLEQYINFNEIKNVKNTSKSILKIPYMPFAEYIDNYIKSK